jgi:hypothetical protein
MSSKIGEFNPKLRAVIISSLKTDSKLWTQNYALKLV